MPTPERPRHRRRSAVVPAVVPAVAPAGPSRAGRAIPSDRGPVGPVGFSLPFRQLLNGFGKIGHSDRDLTLYRSRLMLYEHASPDAASRERIRRQAQETILRLASAHPPPTRAPEGMEQSFVPRLHQQRSSYPVSEQTFESTGVRQSIFLNRPEYDKSSGDLASTQTDEPYDFASTEPYNGPGRAEGGSQGEFLGSEEPPVVVRHTEDPAPSAAMGQCGEKCATCAGRTVCREW